MQLRTMALQCALTHRAGVPFHPRAEEAEDTAMTDDDDKGVSAATVAGYLGISARAVADLGKRGIAVKAGPGCWRLRESVSRYCDDLRRQAKGKGGELAAAERGRLASAQADLVALRVAKQRGGLLDAREVEREWTDVLRVVRSGMLALPSRVGAQRRSDVHRMTWADVAGDTIRVVQQKSEAHHTLALRSARDLGRDEAHACRHPDDGARSPVHGGRVQRLHARRYQSSGATARLSAARVA